MGAAEKLEPVEDVRVIKSWFEEFGDTKDKSIAFKAIIEVDGEELTVGIIKDTRKHARPFDEEKELNSLVERVTKYVREPSFKPSNDTIKSLKK